MRRIFVTAPALLFAGMAAAQSDGRANPLDPQANVPPIEFRSTLEGYRPFVQPERRDWREANEEVGTAGGDAGHRPGLGTGEQSSRPQPAKPETSRGAAQKGRAAPSHQDHHK